LKEEFQSQGHTVSILRVFPSRLEELSQFDRLILQYTPYLWSQNIFRLSPGLLFRVFKIKTRLKTPIDLVAHEIHYPISFSLRGVFLGYGQWLQFLALAYFSDRVFFTYRAAFEKLVGKGGRWLKSKGMILPVGSNIPRLSSSPVLPFSESDFILLHFGGNHPTHFLNWTVTAFLEAKRLNPRARLVWVGVSEIEKDKILKILGFEGFLGEEILGTGFLSEEQVSGWLKRADIVLAPFMDGVSTRRGSVMAALSHARPVVTTRGWATDPLIPWSDFLVLTEVDGDQAKEQYVESVRELIQEGAQREKLGRSGEEAYSKYFSWSVIVNGFQLPREGLLWKTQ